MVRILNSKTKTLSPLRLVSLYFPFQGAGCGILWGERQIPSYSNSIVGLIRVKPTKGVSGSLRRSFKFFANDII